MWQWWTKNEFDIFYKETNWRADEQNTFFEKKKRKLNVINSSLEENNDIEQGT